MKAISEYAAAKGLEMGGYDLLADTRGRGHDPTVECIKCSTNETDGKTVCAPDGNTCLASQGSDAIFDNIIRFVNATSWGSVETDGPYEGESCASTNHSHVSADLKLPLVLCVRCGLLFFAMASVLTRESVTGRPACQPR